MRQTKTKLADLIIGGLLMTAIVGSAAALIFPPGSMAADRPQPDDPIQPVRAVTLQYETDKPIETHEPRPEPMPTPTYSSDELNAVALTLSGECYDDQRQDKLNVAWVICNRARDGRFGSTVIDVVSSTEYGTQFVGYWRQSRSVSDDDIAVAGEVLAAFYADEESPHDYLYFTGGSGKMNSFR